MQADNQQLVSQFIEQIWNKRNFEKLDQFLHTNFNDHSLPPALTPDKTGLQSWIMETGKAFEHTTIIEDQVTDNKKSVVKIKMNLKHIGKWRNMEPTGMVVSTTGYRLYKIADGKITDHWALIDGEGIENQLKAASHGCKVNK